MTMRRYRFVEDGLTLGLPENERVVEETRRNVKLWYRLGPGASRVGDTGMADTYYRETMAREGRVMFPGLAEMLDRSDVDRCSSCRTRNAYGPDGVGEFGGVVLCDGCRSQWDGYLRDFPSRMKKVLERP
jgi:hypothetical protein